MNPIKELERALLTPLPLFAAHKKQPRMGLATVLTAFTALLNASAGWILGRLAYGGQYGQTLAPGRFLLLLALSLGGFGAACLLMAGLSAIFKKKIGPRQIFSTWALSLIPTALCIVVTEVSEAFFLLFVGRFWLGLGLSLALIMLLAWKAILFFMELQVVLELTPRQTVLAALITAPVYMLILMASLRLGLKVPML